MIRTVHGGKSTNNREAKTILDQWKRRKLEKKSDAASGTLFRVSKSLYRSKKKLSIYFPL
jgi:hypothetical protein